MSNPIATILMEDGKKMTAELYPDKAPNTVNNFISLANKGFYDGLTFHRVIPGFMIQGGCPDGTGMGGPGYEIKGEFASNGFAQNDLKHTTGVLSMARTMAPDSAGSQFFVMVAPAGHLDGEYAAFGQVIEGTEDAIAISPARPPAWAGNWPARSRTSSLRLSAIGSLPAGRTGWRAWPSACRGGIRSAWRWTSATP